jgi:hypothetical protein
VSVGTSDYMEDQDHMVLEVIVKEVSPEMLGSITSKLTTKTVWEAIILCNVSVHRVRMAKASMLKRSHRADH